MKLDTRAVLLPDRRCLLIFPSLDLLRTISLPSYARQSCSLGSKRYGIDLSKLYGTTRISGPCRLLFLSLSLVASLFIPPVRYQHSATDIEPSSLSILQRLFPFTNPADKSYLPSRIFPLGCFFSLSLSPLMSSSYTLMSQTRSFISVVVYVSLTQYSLFSCFYIR